MCKKSHEHIILCKSIDYLYTGKFSLATEMPTDPLNQTPTNNSDIKHHKHEYS